MPETEPAIEAIPPLTTLTEEEEMLRDTVRQFAQQEIAPRVREMDEAQKLDAGILEHLFKLGLMAIEAPLELGGAGASFFSAVLAVEEISRIDPAVAVIVDV
jgi:alkylation response protein AidB-like acyl-CoA dehydrogenase